MTTKCQFLRGRITSAALPVRFIGIGGFVLALMSYGIPAFSPQSLWLTGFMIVYGIGTYLSGRADTTEKT